MSNRIENAVESIDRAQREALREALASAFRAGYMVALPLEKIRDGYADELEKEVQYFLDPPPEAY